MDGTCFLVVDEVVDVVVDVVEIRVVESNFGDRGITLTVGDAALLAWPFLLPPAVGLGLLGRRGTTSSRIVEVILSSSSSKIVVGC